MKTNKPETGASRGFTLIEMIIVVGIMAVMVLASLPAISNSTETRALDTAASDVQMALQMAKWQAASLKQSHRVRFATVSGGWTIYIDRESATGTWTAMAGWLAKRISTRLSVTVNLSANSDVIFLPTGFVSGYDGTKNSIAIASPKLVSLSQPGQRTIRILAGGSVQYTKS